MDEQAIATRERCADNQSLNARLQAICAHPLVVLCLRPEARWKFAQWLVAMERAGAIFPTMREAIARAETWHWSEVEGDPVYEEAFLSVF
mgnify:CR=1 FL=1